MYTNSQISPQFACETPEQPLAPVLKVIGLGGGGSNAVERMIELGLTGVEFIAANTDFQALQRNPAPTKILLGPQSARGFGAGGDPSRGRQAAEESREALAAAMAGADMVFLTAGMGGGTGTGSIPVAAEIARSIGAVTVAVVTMPFSFEMGKRQRNATEGLARLRQHTHTLISIPNDRLLYVAPRNLPMETAFRLADDVLRQSVQGIAELITEAGMINVDFAHVRRLICMGGGALMSIGHGQGENKALQALDQALHHPLLENVSLENAGGVIVNFTGGKDLGIIEVQEAVTLLQAQMGDQADIVLGVINDTEMDGRAQVILVVTGLGAPTLEDTLRAVNTSARTGKPQPVSASLAADPAPAEIEPLPQPRSEAIPPVTLRQPAHFSTAGASALKSSSYELPAFLRSRQR